MMPAGDFKYIVSIMSYVQRRDAMGGMTGSWVAKYSNLPAFVEDFAGKEKYSDESSRDINYARKRIKIRYIKAVTVRDRILYDGEQYDILRIEQLGFREATRFLVELAK